MSNTPKYTDEQLKIAAYKQEIACLRAERGELSDNKKLSSGLRESGKQLTIVCIQNDELRDENKKLSSRLRESAKQLAIVRAELATVLSERL